MMRKGRRTIVFLRDTRWGKTIIKVPRNEKGIQSILRERITLSYLNALGIPGVPRVYHLDGHTLYEEYIPGTPLGKYLKSVDVDVSRLVKRALFRAYLLDVVGVWHKELSLAHKHLIITKDDVYIIDFGHSAIGVHWRTLPSLASYLFFRLRLMEADEGVIKIMKEYKRGRVGSFTRLLQALDLRTLRQPL